MPASKACRPPSATEASAAIRALSQRYIDAARTNDAAWFGRHMADDVVVVLSSGSRLRKTEFLAMMRAEPKNCRSLTVARYHGPCVRSDGSGRR